MCCLETTAVEAASDIGLTCGSEGVSSSWNVASVEMRPHSKRFQYRQTSMITKEQSTSCIRPFQTLMVGPIRRMSFDDV